MKPHREIEVKLRVPDVRVIRRRLRELGARAGKRQHEMNTLFDTPRAALRKRGCLLRLRTVGGRSRVTLKGPSVRSRGDSRYKIRREQEWDIRRPQQLTDELARNLLRPTFRYEKFRTEYGLPRLKGLKILLDETPIGDFLELEGPRRQIDRAARSLGYTPVDYLTSSYGALYVAHCRRRGLRPSNMLFPRRKPSKK